MFEDTTNYDFDDDDLGTPFTPVFSSTQGFSQKQRQTKELPAAPGNPKRFKSDPVVTDNQRKISRNPSFELCKSKDTFCSPSKVVTRIFPGPAGLLPDRLQGNKSISELFSEEHVEQTDEFLCSQQTLSVFEDGPWKCMTEDFSTAGTEQLYEKFNINWIKQSSALKKQVVSHKAPFLAAIIQSVIIDADSKTPTVSVTLKDSTGVIGGTILYSLYEENVSAFTVGSVLVLKQFGVLSMEDSYCVTITSNNLLGIYYLNVAKNGPMCKNQTKKGAVEKLILQECSVGEIWKKHEDYLIEISKQKTYHRTVNSRPNLGKLFPNHCNNFVNPYSGPSKAMNNSTYQRTGIDFSSNYSVPQNNIVSPIAMGSVRNFELNEQENTIEQNFKENDSVIISCSQISLKSDKEHTEIWKNLFEEVDADALFDDF